MKSFFKSIYCLMLEFGYARAATALAREGRIEEAKTLILAKRDCKC